MSESNNKSDVERLEDANLDLIKNQRRTFEQLGKYLLQAQITTTQLKDQIDNFEDEIIRNRNLRASQSKAMSEPTTQ
jgi:predicted  nucleic acid-binding Zn-ribbon protein